MLFYVKLQLKMDRMGEMMGKSAKGEIPSVEKYATIYCSSEKPGLGYTIFHVNSREELEEILVQIKPYSKVYEIAPVVTLGEFQSKMTGAV